MKTTFGWNYEELGSAKVVLTVKIENLDNDSYQKICNRIEEIVRYEVLKEEIEKLCNHDADITVEGHEEFSSYAEEI